MRGCASFRHRNGSVSGARGGRPGEAATIGILMFELFGCIGTRGGTSAGGDRTEHDSYEDAFIVLLSSVSVAITVADARDSW
ncbi:unnamed protein product [Rotaria sp. Silwood2]|nr:unnamed protein product [Rotaria sp. Silwood2]